MQFNRELVAILEYFERERGLDRETTLAAIEEGLLSVYRKRMDIEEGTRLHIDPKTSEVHLLTPGGERVDAPELPSGRIIAQNARQMIMQRIRRAEKAKLFKEYQGREGEVVTGLVEYYDKGALVVNLGRTEAVFPASQLTRAEKYKRKGTPVRGVITSVTEGEHGLRIELSATVPAIVNHVFTQEITEIRDGIVEIKAVARVAGEAAKVAVASRDARIDPVGTCIGVRGTRVRAVMKELGGERVDVIQWKEKPSEMIAAMLAPARVVSVGVDEEKKFARVTVPDDQLAVAIGRRGLNVKLASGMSGYTVEVRSESAEKNEELPALVSLPGIDEALALALKEAGYAALRDLLNADPDELAAVGGMGPEKAAGLMETVRAMLPGEKPDKGG